SSRWKRPVVRENTMRDALSATPASSITSATAGVAGRQKAPCPSGRGYGEGHSVCGNLDPYHTRVSPLGVARRPLAEGEAKGGRGVYSFLWQPDWHAPYPF